MDYNALKPIQKRRSLAIASVVLGGVSCFCCLGTGIGVIPALIGLIFGIIAVVSGSPQARKLGWIGLVASGIGLILNVVILIYAIWVINWDQLTLENISSIDQLDPNNEKEFITWLQQFLKINISKFMY